MFEVFCDGDLHDIARRLNEMVEAREDKLYKEMIIHQKIDHIRDIQIQAKERKMLAETTRELMLNYIDENCNVFVDQIRDEMQKEYDEYYKEYGEF